MGVVKVNVNDDLFSPDLYKPIPKGIYLFSIGNLPGVDPSIKPEKVFQVQTSKSSGNPMVPIQVRIEGDETGAECKEKGKVVFDNAVLSEDFGIKKLTHLALSTGAMTKDEISQTGGVDLERFSPDLRGKCEVAIRMEKPYDDPTGEPEPRNIIRRYLFEQ